jgi:hypothetical protein
MMEKSESSLAIRRLVDQLHAGRESAEMFAKIELFDTLKKVLSEEENSFRADLNAELVDLLEEDRAKGGGSRRNGHAKKDRFDGYVEMMLSTVRDWAGTCGPNRQISAQLFKVG